MSGIQREAIFLALNGMGLIFSFHFELSASPLTVRDWLLRALYALYVFSSCRVLDTPSKAEVPALSVAAE